MSNQVNKTILEIEDIKAIQPDLSHIKIIPQDISQRIQVIIFDKDKITLKLLTTNNFPDQLKNIVAKLEEKWFKSELYYTSPEWFEYAFGRYKLLEDQENTKQQAVKRQKQAEWKWALTIIDELFAKRDSMEPWEFILEIVRLAFQTWASDLHFQPEANGMIMRIRIDWVLQEILQFTHDDFRKYLQKLKYISGTKMNIDYIPQDWRFSFEATDINWDNRKVDCRVNFMPWVWQESTVIRFLDPTKGISTFEKIWFTERTYKVLKRNLEKNTWIIIIAGPTWSGKTTTLYTILSNLNNGKKKIITLEDPIEYELSWIQQSQINYNKWYTYEIWLKAILRHDPDTILVWETRSSETADSSINAALTWHQVFTTLHTNWSIESIPRLLNMDVKPYMLAPAVNLILAQRLCRRLCPHCWTRREANYWENAEIKQTIKKISDAIPTIKLDYDGKVPQAVWCEKCNGTWYQGRVAIIEVFEITDETRKMIVEWRTTTDMYWLARSMWFLTMQEDWIIKVLDWITTLDEIRRVI